MPPHRRRRSAGKPLAAPPELRQIMVSRTRSAPLLEPRESELRHGDSLMTPSIHRLLFAGLATTALLAPAAAFAQAGAATFPSKPIHIVVTFTSGGAPDILARL